MIIDSIIIPDIKNNLFPNLSTLIAHLIATAIILFVMQKLLYKPFKKYEQNQKEYIENNIRESEINRIKSNNDANNAEQLLETAKMKSENIINDAKIKSLNVSEKIISNANDEAHRIISNARIEIRKDRLKMQEDAREEIIEIAFLAAEKIIKKSVDNNDNRKIVKEFINQVQSKDK